VSQLTKPKSVVDADLIADEIEIAGTTLVDHVQPIDADALVPGFPATARQPAHGGMEVRKPARSGRPESFRRQSLFRSDGIGTGLYLFVLTRFLYAKRLKTL
jgi:hypothetical protein